MAIKHNNPVPNVHFRKWWQKHVKTWFNQAGRKKTRRVARQQKAAKSFPRPAGGFLRPAVHPATVRYNFKLRQGRGFTLDELKAAGISKHEARSVGICVDHRRRNHCEESLKTNADRLALYKSKLLVFPRKAGEKHLKKGDSTKAELADAKQNACKTILPIVQEDKRVRARAITSEETAMHAKLKDHDGNALRAHSAYRILRSAAEAKRNVGRKIRRDRKKAAENTKL